MAAPLSYCTCIYTTYIYLLDSGQWIFQAERQKQASSAMTMIANWQTKQKYPALAPLHTQLAHPPAPKGSSQANNYEMTYTKLYNSWPAAPYYDSGGWPVVSCCRSLGSIPGQCRWGLWWAKYHWDKVISQCFSVFPSVSLTIWRLTATLVVVPHR
jgi:hypothetical protein